MALRQEQQLKQTQKLTPLQMQVIKLVELTSVEVEDRIKQEIEDNPALEVSDTSTDATDDYGNDDAAVSQEDIILGDYISEDDIPDYRLNTSKGYKKNNFIEATFSDHQSLHEYLQEQISLQNLSERKQKIAEYIIGNIDENGYLHRNLQSISDDILFQQNMDVSEEELDELLKTIQKLDPSGVGARDLQECLLIQLRKRHMDDVNRLAQNVVSNYFEEFSRKHYDKIIRQLNVSEEELRDAIDEIVSLNPKPGNILSDNMEMALNNITPDFIVESDRGEVFMSLNNRNVPELRINRDFSEMLQGYVENKEAMSSDNKQAVLFIKQKVDSAKSFIEAVKQRQNTLQKTMEAIISLQYDFFLTEDETMLKPMILEDVANKTGFDISTISRVSNSKYVQTNSGVYPLKFFFSEGMPTDSGENVSTREVKLILKESIENEDHRKPLTDEQLTKLLNEKGYIIARRTTAKYREQLNIPVARLRKKL